MNKNVYRFFYLTPDGTHHYLLDSRFKVSLSPSRAKHYMTDDPAGQQAIIEENFKEISDVQFYSCTTFWKSVRFDEVLRQVTVSYEIVPDNERRPFDHEGLSNPGSGVTLGGGTSDGGGLAQVAGE